MVSLADYYQAPQGTPSAYVQAGLMTDRANIENQAATEQAIAARDFRTRTLPDLVNRFAARGTFFGGMATVAASRAQEDYERALGSLEFDKQQRLSDLTRNSFLATMGVVL